MSSDSSMRAAACLTSLMMALVVRMPPSIFLALPSSAASLTVSFSELKSVTSSWTTFRSARAAMTSSSVATTTTFPFLRSSLSTTELSSISADCDADAARLPSSLPFPDVARIPGFLPCRPTVRHPKLYIQGVGDPRDAFKNQPLGLFFQDSWKIKPNLTLNYGVRYDIEFPPKFTPPGTLALAAYDQLGLQKGIDTDKNNFQPRIGLAWDPHGDGKTVFRASYGIFYDHPLLGLYFLGDASDGSKSGQLLFVGGSPCGPNPASASPANLNATNIFQGILATSGCLPGSDSVLNMGYLPTSNASTRFAQLTFHQPELSNKLAIWAAFFPLGFQPFGYPQAKNFVYAYSQQIN